MRPLPRSTLLSTWGTAVLAGRTSPDVAAAAVTRADASHRVVGLPDEPDPLALTVAFGRLRAAGVTALRLALPVPGDAPDLPGPAEFGTDALEVGEAVLTVGGRALGLLPRIGAATPESSRAAVRWDAYPVTSAVATAPVAGGGTLAEAERELTEGLASAVDTLTALDVARWRPEVADEIAAVRAPSADDDALPPGFPVRARRVLALARRVQAITDLALQDPGAAASAQAVAVRTEPLRALAADARHAQVCACNAWLPEVGG